MRNYKLTRNTLETKISIEINLDGSGISNIDTKIGFFNHMLQAFSKHSQVNLDVFVDGDLEVDTHHSVEDTAIVLGKCINEALGDKFKINRYANFTMCMDEALVFCAIDLSDRGYYVSDYDFVGNCGDFETQMVDEFFNALALNAKMNLHFMVLRGKNNHHIIEAMFKSFAVCFKQAISINDKLDDILSTKGSL